MCDWSLVVRDIKILKLLLKILDILHAVQCMVKYLMLLLACDTRFLTPIHFLATKKKYICAESYLSTLIVTVLCQIFVADGLLYVKHL